MKKCQLQIHFRNFKPTALTLILFLISIFCFSQSNDPLDYYIPQKTATKFDSVPYSGNYIFEDGIFLKFKNFKQNSPIAKKQIILDYPSTEADFMEQVLKRKKIIYKELSDKIIEIPVAEIWGFSIQNKIYKMSSNGCYAEIQFVGTLCYLNYQRNSIVTFVTNRTKVLNPNSMGFTTNFKAKSYDYYIYDTQTKTYLNDAKELKSFLKKNDKDLFEEFSALGFNQRKNSVFLYVKKYNEKHPFYLPVK